MIQKYFNLLQSFWFWVNSAFPQEAVEICNHFFVRRLWVLPNLSTNIKRHDASYSMNLTNWRIKTNCFPEWQPRDNKSMVDKKVIVISRSSHGNRNYEKNYREFIQNSTFATKYEVILNNILNFAIKCYCLTSLTKHIKSSESVSLFA